jgi:thiamine-phosphate pyrophosphorylase
VIDAGEQIEARCQPYLISPLEIDPAQLDAALSAGRAVAVLLRLTHLSVAAVHDLQQICAGRVACLLQDDVDLALSCGADGIHLTDPAKVREARTRLGPDRILGASCGHSRHAAMLAGEDGADYIAFGEVGRGPQPPLLELIAWWHELFVLPCLALGAFDGASCRSTARAGADFIGVGDEVWQHPDGAAAGMRSVLEAIRGA